MMKYKDRENNIFEEETGQDKLLKTIYSSVLGRALLKILTKPVVSRAVGAFLNTSASTFLVNPFIERNNIPMDDYVKKIYYSYNDFFTRQIRFDKRPIQEDENVLISPCDGKVSVYPIDKNSSFTIKGTDYKLSRLLDSRALAQKYEGGICYIIRLTVDDYHRYCYVDSGRKSNNYHINGVLHTVNPVALGYVDFYKENSREFTLLKTDHFGTICQIEVGALCVGKITNNMNRGYFHKGFEKGMFEFGGSTIVLLTQAGRIKPDHDLIYNTGTGYETLVKMGEQIGKKIC